MTKHDCKSETHSTPKNNERRLTVRQILYQYPPRKDDPPQQGHREKWVPWLQMKGLWLERAGFTSDTAVKVRIMEGCLVITAEDN